MEIAMENNRSRSGIQRGAEFHNWGLSGSELSRIVNPRRRANPNAWMGRLDSVRAF